MTLGLVIVNYRTPELAIGCIDSLSTADDHHPVVVVDNASGDESVLKLTSEIDRRAWKSWVTLVPCEKNGGYAAGNNVGIRHLAKMYPELEYVLLLNPDTVVNPGALRELIKFMNAHPKAGVAGSRLEGRDGQVERSAHPFPTPWSEFGRSSRTGVIQKWLSNHGTSVSVGMEPYTCQWVSGAAMVIRLAVFESVGLLDERYFLYFEEVEFCRRTSRAGWEIWYVPASRVVHFEGESTGIRKPHRRRPRYWYDSRRRFFLQGYGIPGLVLADVCWLLGRSIGIPKMLLRGELGTEPALHTVDLLEGDFRSICSGRASRDLREARPV